jgi:hypothetical protein
MKKEVSKKKKLEYKKEIYVVTAEDTQGGQWHCFKEDIDTLIDGERAGVYQFVKEAIVSKQVKIELKDVKNN